MAFNVPYNIDYVVHVNGLDKQKYKSGASYLIDCPFCGRKRKLSIKTDGNVWSCPACGESGGMLQLHAKLHKQSNSWAYHDLLKSFNELDEATKKQIETAPVATDASSSSQAADLSIRSQIFRLFLSRLPISDALLTEMSSDKRGNLSKDDIVKLGYREFDNHSFTSEFGIVNPAEFAYCKYWQSQGMVSPDLKDMPKLMQKLYLSGNHRIPGFTVKNGHICPSDPGEKVAFLPVRARTGEISFFQTMFPKLPDNASEKAKLKYKKYGRYSASDKNGCTTSKLQSVHYSIPNFDFSSDKTPENVWLTEGVLKSDIASFTSNRPFIALVGITTHAQLPEELAYLKAHGTKKITVATDMDYLEKASVANAMQTIIQMIKDAGLLCEVATWNPEYKGIDDFLIACKAGKSNLNIEFHEK